MDFLEPILQILKFITDPICEYLEYHRKLDGNLKILENKLDELNSQKEDIELRLSAENHLGKMPKKEVVNWLQNVESINNEISLVEKKANEVKYFSRGRLGKRVVKKIQKVKEFHKTGSSFNSLVVDAPTRGVILSTTTIVGESTAKKNLNEIWNYLMGDEVKKIGVCGVGGVGKTTIMKHVNNKLLTETDKFNDVIWVTVSQQLDLAKLQQDIATTLKEDLSKEGDVVKRAGILLRILKGRSRYVLILDNMSKAFPLEEVGILEPTIDNGCKLVITTRSIQVCHSMGCEIIQVKPLSKEEALKLFLDKVGRGVLQVPTLEETVNFIVDQCAGLPLAIVTMANKMKGVNDVNEWRNALNELCENVKSVKEMETEVFE